MARALSRPVAASQLSDRALADLVAAVQDNCDLADARHAREAALCTYLLAMREYYRWRSGVACGAALDHGRVGRFIAEREMAWDARADEDAGYRRLPLGDGLDPFDTSAADALLAPARLVYGAGIGRFGAPLFFLAERGHEERRGAVEVVVAGRELARGVVAPPALSRGGRVVVRTDAMRRWLWSRAEAGRPARASGTGPAEDADPAVEIDRLVATGTETLVLHELGEVQAAARLGPDWERMLAAVGDRQAELVLRAVRDLLADALVTLPTLADRAALPSLRFWWTHLDPLRRELAPELLALRPALERGDLDAVRRAGERGLPAWEALAQRLLERWRAAGAPAVSRAARDLIGAAPAD